MTLKGTPGIVTPTGVAGLDFRDEADTVNALVPKLRSQGIEAIVVLVHQGGFQSSPNVGDINGCDGNLKNPDGSDSDIANIVKRLDNAVDLVISGHTHSAYNCSANTVDVRSVSGNAVSTPRPTGLANKTGRLVPVTSASAFGRLLTDIDLTIDPKTRDVTAVSATTAWWTGRTWPSTRRSPLIRASATWSMATTTWCRRWPPRSRHDHQRAVELGQRRRRNAGRQP